MGAKGARSRSLHRSEQGEWKICLLVEGAALGLQAEHRDRTQMLAKVLRGRLMIDDWSGSPLAEAASLLDSNRHEVIDKEQRLL